MARSLPFEAAELKEGQLFGIPLRVVDDDEVVHTYTDAKIEQRIRAAVAYFERRTKLWIGPRKVVTRPEITAPTAQQGVDYDVATDPLDYEAPMFYANGFLQLRHRPIISLEKLELRFPENQILLTYPKDWLRLNHKVGQVNVMAVTGAASPVIVGRGGGYLPLLTGQMLSSSVPGLIYADYTAGIDWNNEATRDEHEDLLLALEQQAAINVLLDVGRGVSPGVTSQSLSQDGQSESVSYARNAKGGVYSAEITELSAQVEAFLKLFKADRKGPIWTVL